MSTSDSATSAAMESINAAQQATMASQVMKSSGAGKAYQMIAQSTAIAMQDATDYLRNMNTISSTVAGVAMAQMLAGGDLTVCTQVLSSAQALAANSANNFKIIGENAAEVLRKLPES